MLHVEFLNVANASFLQSSDLDWFCNKTDQIMTTQIKADCGGLHPRVNCPCCATCCDHSDHNTNDSGDDTAACSVNVLHICEMSNTAYTDPSGAYFDERRDTVCHCEDRDEDGWVIQKCQDRSCPSCTSDGSICALNHEYGKIFSPVGTATEFKTTFKYVSGPDVNETVTIFSDATRTNSECVATVNGQECSRCYHIRCDDFFMGFTAECENVLVSGDGEHVNSGIPFGAGSVNPCDDQTVGSNGGNLVLAALDTQDPLLSSGCPTRLDTQWY